MKKLSPLAQKFFAEGVVAECPIYDMHAHMGPIAGLHIPHPDAASMAAAADRAGVKWLVFCHHAALMSPDIGNRPNIDAVRAFPNQFRAYCGINPNYPELVGQDLETFDQYGDVYVGFKLMADYHDVSVADDRCRSVWQYADEHQLLVLLHTWGGSIYDGPEQVRLVAEKYHDVKILCGHSCHGQWDEAVQLVRDFPNVYLELCAVLDERGVVDKFVAECGSGRLIYGTDMPWFNQHYYIGGVLGAEMTDEDRHNILHRNAEKLLAPFNLPA